MDWVLIAAPFTGAFVQLPTAAVRFDMFVWPTVWIFSFVQPYFTGRNLDDWCENLAISLSTFICFYRRCLTTLFMLLVDLTNKEFVHFLISNFCPVLNVVLFLFGDFRLPNFKCRRFGTLCSFHIHRRCKEILPPYSVYEDGIDRAFRNVGT